MTDIGTLQITYQSISTLKSNPRNARTHSKSQIQQIARSIEAFGFNNPALIDKNNTIIAGHGRIEAAKLLKMEKVPIIQIEHLTDAQLRAYMIADNQIALNAGWDEDMLAIEFQELSRLELDFSLDITGFELPAIDFMIQSLGEVPKEAESIIPDPPQNPITKPGDIWILGDHKILCANALHSASYEILLQSVKAQMIITDPPFNEEVANIGGLGSIKHAEFAMASGEMTEDEFRDFLANIAARLIEHSIPGSIHYIFMDWRHMHELLDATKTRYTLKNLCIWNKSNGGMGSLYRSKHELVFVFKNGEAAHINNIELGKHGRYRTNVWDYPGQNSLDGRDGLLKAHPTVKPISLIGDAILDCSHRNGIILDPFGGSGTTLIAAEQTGRHARLIELEPRFVDVTVERWQALTNKHAVHAVTGASFNSMKGV